jgi:hypothetical protein
MFVAARQRAERLAVGRTQVMVAYPSGTAKVQATVHIFQPGLGLSVLMITESRLGDNIQL